MRSAADLAEVLISAGLPLVSCDTNKNVRLSDGATSAQIAQARALADAFDFNAQKVDTDIERIKAILAKADGDITAGELKELVLKFVRKRI